MDGPLAGAENMAADAALLEAQRDPAALPVLRFYGWSGPTVTFGRLQDPALAGAFAAGVDTVRRPTGGGMVRHERDLSFSLCWRRGHPGLPRCLKDVYRAVHGAAREALRAAGVDADVQGPARGGDVCADAPTEDDLLWRGGKVLGGALRVTSWGRLYQGNLWTDRLGWSAERAAPLLARAFAEFFFKSPPIESIPSTT